MKAPCSHRDPWAWLRDEAEFERRRGRMAYPGMGTMLLMGAGAGSPSVPSLPPLLVGSSVSPFIAAYKGGSGPTFGSQYSAPATTPAGTVSSIAFSPDGNWVALAVASSPFIEVYAWSKASGFGAKVSDPVTLPGGAANDVAWSPDGAYVGVAGQITPFQAVYPFSGGAFGAKVADPVTLPSATGDGIAWSHNGLWLAISHATTPFVHVYPWSGGYGAAVSNPSVVPSSASLKVRWSPSDANLVLTPSITGAVQAYDWSSGFGTRYSVTPGAKKASWSPDGNYIGAGHSGIAGAMSAYPFTNGSGFGTLISGPTPAGGVNDFSWDSTGAFIAIAQASSPFVAVYNWTPGVFGSKLTNPVALPPGAGTAVVWNN